jgi:hypothetical protein
VPISNAEHSGTELELLTASQKGTGKGQKMTFSSALAAMLVPAPTTAALAVCDDGSEFPLCN